MDVLTSASNYFWSPTIWLPPNITWEHFDSDPSYAQFYDLAYPFPLALVLIAARIIVERAIFKPLGHFLKIKDRTCRKPESNKVLESAYDTRQKDYNGLRKSTGMTERQIQRWMRQQKMAGR